MEIQAELKNFKARLDPLIEAYFDSVIKELRKEDDLVAEAIGHVKTIVLSGGKRLRSAFMYYGYLGAGGTETEKMLHTSMSIELIHSFLLIHDDIIDRDDLRHGVETLHKRYTEFGRRFFAEQDVEHFGNAIALVMGDMLYSYGNNIIFQADFPKDRVFAALSRLQNVVSFTVVGQARDIYMEFKRQATEEEVLNMYRNKTAKYTVEGPLHLGALLAGASEEHLAHLSDYALPLGIAFQIQDDILGIFGSVEQIGKPIGSDIKEGKLTLLVARALQNGTKQQRERLREILNRGALLTESERQEFCSLIIETGSLAQAKALAQKYIEQGKCALLVLKAEVTPEAYIFLEGVAEYMTKREL
ncbi:MAG: polyprenyl synthetase family protein [Candidatus Moranbacteria bacterium]|jgi:geranylgeranyl diphosphate synthase type I|nr:polyprenyl synthetase family protein [Candidatus Moranbacteria bacterium]